MSTQIESKLGYLNLEDTPAQDDGPLDFIQLASTEDVSANSKEPSPYQDAIDRYVGALDSIYQLTTEINQVSSDAFLNLAKANNLSQVGRVKKFGPDYYDYRDRAAVLSVRVGAKDEDHNDKDAAGFSGSQPLDFSLVNHLEYNENEEKVRLRSQLEQERESTGDIDIYESTLKNRSKEEKKNREAEIEEKINIKLKQLKREKKKRNPITMFNGGIVPRELLTSQNLYKELVRLSIKLAHYQSMLRVTAEELIGFEGEF